MTVPHEGPGAALWYEEQKAARTAEYVAGLEEFVRGRIESHFGTPLEFITVDEQERWVTWMGHDLDGSIHEEMRAALRQALQIDGQVEP